MAWAAAVDWVQSLAWKLPFAPKQKKKKILFKCLIAVLVGYVQNCFNSIRLIIYIPVTVIAA